MKHWPEAAVLLLLAAAGLQAQRPEPQPLCGFPHIGKIDIHAVGSHTNLSKRAGVTFKVRLDITSDQPNFITLDFTLMYSDDQFEVYAETDEIDSGRVNTEGVDNLVKMFRDSTLPGSIDPGRGIKAIAEEVFGQPPDYDGNGKVFILLTDIRDDYEPGVSEGYVAGYFDPADQTEPSLQTGNGADIIYLDTFPGQLTGNLAFTTFSTLAHEYQHLIHFGRDPNEDSWVNEGLSELSPVLMGLPHRPFTYYLRNTNVNLTSFEGVLADYSRTALFFFYVYGRFGTSFIQAFIINSNNGMVGLESTLSTLTTTNVTELVNDWHLANFINSGPQHSYLEAGKIPPVVMNRRIYAFPETISTGVQPYAAHWTLLSHADNLAVSALGGSGLSLTLFKGEDPTPIDGSSLFSGSFSDTAYGVSYHDLYILATAQAATASLELTADGDGYLRTETISYDQDTPNSNQIFISFNDLQAAVDFSIPDDGTDLASFSFLPLTSDTAIVRIYYDGLAADKLVFTDTIRAAHQLTWQPYLLPAGLSVAGKRVFIGLSGTKVALGYNDIGETQRSHLAIGDSLLGPLEDFSIDPPNPLTGNWSVRLTYLTASPPPEPPQPPPIAADSISQFYANPFVHDGSPDAAAYLAVGWPSAVQVVLYNIMGQEVWRFLRPADDLAVIVWRGIDNSGRPAPSGVYVAVVTGGDQRVLRKLVLIR